MWPVLAMVGGKLVQGKQKQDEADAYAAHMRQLAATRAAQQKTSDLYASAIANIGGPLRGAAGIGATGLGMGNSVFQQAYQGGPLAPRPPGSGGGGGGMMGGLSGLFGGGGG